MRIDGDKVVRRESRIKVQRLVATDRVRLEHANHKLPLRLAQRNTNNGDLVAGPKATRRVVAEVILGRIAQHIWPGHRERCAVIHLADGGHVLVHFDGLDVGQRKAVLVAAVGGVVDGDQKAIVADENVHFECATWRGVGRRSVLGLIAIN